MPQAWQGGSGVLAFADAGSKLEGTGLEKVQMTQTQVALLGGGALGMCHGLPPLGEDVELRGGDEPFTCGPKVDLLTSRRYRVTFAEDLRNPAYELSVKDRRTRMST